MGVEFEFEQKNAKDTKATKKEKRKKSIHERTRKDTKTKISRRGAEAQREKKKFTTKNAKTAKEEKEFLAQSRREQRKEGVYHEGHAERKRRRVGKKNPLRAPRPEGDEGKRASRAAEAEATI